MGGRHRSIILLFLGAIMLSAATPVIAKLIQLGESFKVHGRNPISFCNVLFAGNAVALFVFLLLYQEELGKFEWKKLEGRTIWLCTLVALIVGVLSPSLFFLGIMYTNVVNVIIISTLEIPFMLIIGWLIFKERFGRGVAFGATIMLIGVFISQLFQEHQPPTNRIPQEGAFYLFLGSIPWIGEILLLLSILVSVTSIFLSRHLIQSIPTGFFNIFKLAVGTVVFFCVVVVIFGWQHFADLFSPFLWKWMLLYGGVIIGLRTYVSFHGLRGCHAAEIAISSALIPVFSLIFAYIILQDAPGAGQWVGGAITLLGIMTALIFKLRKEEEAVLQKPVGFEGI